MKYSLIRPINNGSHSNKVSLTETAKLMEKNQTNGVTGTLMKKKIVLGQFNIK